MTIIKTNHEDLDENGQQEGATIEQAAAYLNADPANAIIITSVEPNQYIIWGASGLCLRLTGFRGSCSSALQAIEEAIA